MLAILVALSTAAHAGPYTFTCTPEALAGTHKDTLRVYRNELFARHGRTFQSADLQAIFGAASWYTPDPTYTDDRLTNADRGCLNRIQALEKQRPAAPIAPDLDRDGTPDPIRWDGHTLHLGTVTKKLIPGHTDPMEVPPPILIDLDLHDGLQELVLTTQPGVEDEWQFLVVRLSKGEIQVLMEAPAWMSHSHFSVMPQQLVHVDHNCGQETTTTWHFSTLPATTTTSARWAYDPEKCAACPYVYDVDANRFLGEILRDQRHPNQKRADRIDLGSIQPGTRRLRLVELKPETTLLDAIFIEVDGTPIAPDGCPGAAYCTVDGTPHPIDTRTGLDLTFTIPTGGTATLVADGYYLPYTPTRTVGDQTLLEPAVSP